MRAAAVRLAKERLIQDADPAQGYGCVDWFRYDVTQPSAVAAAAPARVAPGVPQNE